MAKKRITPKMVLENWENNKYEDDDLEYFIQYLRQPLKNMSQDIAVQKNACELLLDLFNLREHIDEIEPDSLYGTFISSIVHAVKEDD